MPGETMTDEGYGVLDVSWTLTHDLTHVGCTYMADKGEVAEVCCSGEKVSVLKLLVYHRVLLLVLYRLTVRANVHEACWSTFELLLHNWGEKNKEREVWISLVS